MDPRRRAGSRLVQPSPESFKSRSRRIRPKAHMGTRGNPTRRRQHPGSRIHLRKGHGRPACFPIHKTVAKINLGTVVRRATLAANENRREISRVSRLPARTGDFSYRNTVTRSTETLLPSPFPPQPPFPRPPVYAAYFAEATKAKMATTGRPVRPNGSFRSLPQKANS
jgi:hypothetical protein